MAKLTKQQVEPHPSLVQCRNAIEKHVTGDRKKAAHICNHLTDKQVEMVLEAGDDKSKVDDALRFVEIPEEKSSEEEPKKNTRRK